MASILSEFDEVGYKEMIREEGYEDGYEDGQQNGIQACIELVQELGSTKDKAVTCVMKKFNLNEEMAASKVNQYWKK